MSVPFVSPISSFELPPELVEALVPLSTVVPVSRRQPIFRQGNPCRGAFLIRSGQCRVSILADNGIEVFVRTLGPGCILGLAGTLCSQPYNATAVALEDSTLALIDIPKFQEFIRARPDLSIAVVQVMSRELAAVNSRSANFAACKECGCTLADTCAQHLKLP